MYDIPLEIQQINSEIFISFTHQINIDMNRHIQTESPRLLRQKNPHKEALLYNIQIQVFQWFKARNIHFGNIEELLERMRNQFNENKKNCISMIRVPVATDSNLLKRRLRKKISITV